MGLPRDGIRLNSPQERTPVNPTLTPLTDHVLRVLHRAQNIFGGDTAPAGPPAFAAPRELEDDLGRGFFGGARR
jgi:hypothetical protein